jgi:hypothetical protein
MLSKLFKHEMRACARLLLPIFLILILLALLDRIVLGLDIFDGSLKVIPVFITVAFIFANIAVGFVTFILIIVRFYKNLISDEGYLMFTLPVKASQLIHSKLIASIIWLLSSVAVIFGSLSFTFGTLDGASEFWDGVKTSWVQFTQEYGNDARMFFAEIILIIFIGIVCSILQIYASVAIGQLVNGHKILGAFGAYVALYTIMQIACTIALVIAGLAFKGNYDDLGMVTAIVMPVTALFTLIFTVIFYFITVILFNRKLNLE